MAADFYAVLASYDVNAGSERTIIPDRWPAMRIDDNPPFDVDQQIDTEKTRPSANDIKITRILQDKLVLWHIGVLFAGERLATTPGMGQQLMTGDVLLLRVFLTGDAGSTHEFSLKGLSNILGDAIPEPLK